MISQRNLSNAAFSVSGLPIPTSLSAGQSITFTLIFKPTAAGSAAGNLVLTADAANSPLNVAVSGTGTAASQLTVSPGSLNFGNVTVGQSSSLNGGLNATGAAVTVSSVSSTSSEFAVSGISFPAVVAVGQNLPFTVTFAPQASGTATATLTFTSDAGNSPSLESLSGNGVAPPPHSVDLSWDASNFQDVVGYNIYRGGTDGGPYSRINAALDAITVYTDLQVNGGQSYYYVVTAVDSNGLESGYSNQVKVVVPAP